MIDMKKLAFELLSQWNKRGKKTHTFYICLKKVIKTSTYTQKHHFTSVLTIKQLQIHKSEMLVPLCV